MMLIKPAGSIMPGGMQTCERTGSEVKVVFGSWGTKVKNIWYGQAQNRDE